MKKYYDPEYDRIVGEDVLQKQYNWFVNNMSGFDKSFEQFVEDNFTEITKANEKYYSTNC